jgi:hypothetical protein
LIFEFEYRHDKLTNGSKHFMIHSKGYLAAYIYGLVAKYMKGQVAK